MITGRPVLLSFVLVAAVNTARAAEGKLFGRKEGVGHMLSDAATLTNEVNTSTQSKLNAHMEELKTQLLEAEQKAEAKMKKAA